MIEEGADTDSRFEPLAIGRTLVWKYRGQVLPSNKKVTLIVDIADRGMDDRGDYVIGDGELWVDGKRIYEAQGLATRAVPRKSGA